MRCVDAGALECKAAPSRVDAKVHVDDAAGGVVAAVQPLQLRVDILEAEQDEAKLLAFSRLVRKKDAEKEAALASMARQAAEKDAVIAALQSQLREA